VTPDLFPVCRRFDSGSSLGIATMPGFGGCLDLRRRELVARAGGSILMVGEASGPSGGASGIFAGENGWQGC